MKHQGPFSGMINYCIEHPVLANLIMVVALITGLASVYQMNRQSLPDFNIETAVVNVIWPGASSEEVQGNITQPLENELFGLEGLVNIRANASAGSGVLVMEFITGTDMGEQLRKIRDKVAVVDLPQDSETPVVFQPTPRERTLSLLFYGPDSLEDLRYFTLSARRELLAMGVDDADIQGLPDQEVAIHTSSSDLFTLGLNARELSDQISQHTQEIPMGSLGKGFIERGVKGQDKLKMPSEFEMLYLKDSMGHLFHLGGMANIQQQYVYGSPLVFYQNKPAVILNVYRVLGSGSDSFIMKDKVESWLKKARNLWSEDMVSVITFGESWKLVKERIDLIMQNGALGFFLIFVLLNGFLFTRVAFWIAVGVPTSVAAALFFLYTQGGSINFLSTFGFLMAFGIIVDDTIVVAEQAFSEYQKGKHPLEAVKVAANMMVAPVLASSVTTIAAFMPLLVMQGLFGKILKDIPLVVMVVIAASLIECFLILPYHVKVALSKINPRHQGLRWSWNQRISHFQYNIFRRFVNHAVDYAWVTIFAGVSLIMIPFMLLGSGRIKFDFFPNLPSDILFLDADFYPGTPAKTIKQFLAEANRSLAQQDRVLNSDGQSMVQVPIQMLYYTSPDGGALAIGNDYSDAHAAMLIGVSSPDSRSVTNEMFMQSVRDDLLKKAPADMLNISLGQPAAGPPGADLRLLIIGNDIHTIKQAAEATKLKLSGINGVVNIKDSLPYGKAEYVLTLTQKAKALGLTKSQLSAQLSASLYGSEVQKHTAFSEIIKVNVRIEDQDQKNANILENLPIIIGQQTIPLGELAQATLSHSFTRYTQYNGKQYAEVSADMQKGVANLQDVLKVVNDQVIPDISQRFDVRFSDEEQSRYETEALNELQYGAILGLLMIYLVLSWVSRSYVWPLVVMVVIPFGLAGALLGHYWLGFPLTLLSIFGLFGLTGIVVNNAIIWLHRYQALLAEGVSEQEAIVDASCQRLRAVFLTTVTTIVGLVPLLLETSLQARFLQPMVISISFGLAMATLLILFVLPALMSILSRGRNKSIRSDG